MFKNSGPAEWFCFQDVGKLMVKVVKAEGLAASGKYTINTFYRNFLDRDRNGMKLPGQHSNGIMYVQN